MYSNDLSIAAYKIEHKGASRRGDVKQQIPEDCWFMIQTTDYYSAKFFTNRQWKNVTFTIVSDLAKSVL